MDKSRLPGLFLAALFTLSLLAAPARAGEEERVLYLYTWSDYFDSEVIRLFEQKHGCRVAIDYFDSNEAMYENLKAGGGGFDIITPSSYMSSMMNKDGMLLPLDHGDLPNLANIDRKFLRFTEDPEMRHSVPYTRTVTGIGYDATAVDAADTGGWGIFSSEKYAGRMTMLDDMREALGAALKYLGHSINSTDAAEIIAAGEVLAGWKRQLARFDVDEAKYGLAEGELLAIQGYNGDVALMMDENPALDFYIPREGSSIASDDFVIAAETPNTTLAHAFINHMYDPEVAALNMASIRYYMPIPAAVGMLDAEIRENPAFDVDAMVLERCEVILDIGEDTGKYERVWEEVRGEE